MRKLDHSVIANRITKKVWEKPSIEVISYDTVQAGIQPGVEGQPLPGAVSPHTSLSQYFS